MFMFYLAAWLWPSFLWDLDRICLSLGLLQSYPLSPVGRQSAPGTPWAGHWSSRASHGIFQPACSLCPAQLCTKSKGDKWDTRVKWCKFCCDIIQCKCSIRSKSKTFTCIQDSELTSTQLLVRYEQKIMNNSHSVHLSLSSIAFMSSLFLCCVFFCTFAALYCR